MIFDLLILTEMDFDNFIEADIEDEEEIMNANGYDQFEDEGGYGIDDQFEQEFNANSGVNAKISLPTQIDNILHMPLSR